MTLLFLSLKECFLFILFQLLLDDITWFTSHDNRIKVYSLPAKIWKGKNPSSAEGKFLINGNRLNNNMRKTN